MQRNQKQKDDLRVFFDALCEDYLRFEETASEPFSMNETLSNLAERLGFIGKRRIAHLAISDEEMRASGMMVLEAVCLCLLLRSAQTMQARDVGGRIH
ncbi:hypothetical protein [Acetobacter fallax]|uniref:Uncharacterized protein n=1 Tax=Acetobacter fallax TaxID=1737473 RepID=A0ABX0KHB2_9PROT|nr:hypothetical protein [Acetobacter fallax]NHO33302.1 hypothetical protein [Acetobacter fallax]NHO36923.1 hypothetical protein [Acetobacter fallax]